MALAQEYHNLCDSYDDRICSGKNEYGESMPMTNVEFQMINANAAQIRKRIIQKGLALGFDQHTVSKAISKYQ